MRRLLRCSPFLLAVLLSLASPATAQTTQTARVTTQTRTDTVVAAAGRLVYPAAWDSSRARWQLCHQVKRKGVSSTWVCSTQTGPWLARVAPPPPIPFVGYTITPNAVTLAPGATQTFTAQGWPGPVPAPTGWTATGGTITAAGVYTAGAVPGTFLVTGVSTTTSHIETASVTITATVGVGVLLRPAAAVVAPTAEQQFCGFAAFTNGVVAMRSLNTIDSTCLREYGLLTPAQRTVTAAQQAVADSQCLSWDATGGSILQEACSGLGRIEAPTSPLLRAAWGARPVWTPQRWRTEFRPDGRVVFVLDPQGQWNRVADAMAERIMFEHDQAKVPRLRVAEGNARNSWESAYGRPGGP